VSGLVEVKSRVRKELHSVSGDGPLQGVAILIEQLLGDHCLGSVVELSMKMSQGACHPKLIAWQKMARIFRLHATSHEQAITNKFVYARIAVTIVPRIQFDIEAFAAPRCAVLNRAVRRLSPECRKNDWQPGVGPHH
jgi:hypothetical protein